MAKILLINPHNPDFIFSEERHIPLGILYLSSSLKKNGHEVLFIDVSNDQITAVSEKTKFNFEEYYKSKMQKIISDFKPDLIGISIHCSVRFSPAIAIGKSIKVDYPLIPIVFGGIHPTIFSRQILAEYDCVDFILQGESESSLIELVNAIENKINGFNRIDGLAYRINGEVSVNKKEKYIEDIDGIPFPDYSLVNIKDYYFNTSKWINPRKLPINLSLYVLSSRSCPRQCTYCSMFLAHGRKHRMRSASNVVDELEYLYFHLNHHYFSFMDDNLTLNKNRTIEMCNLIISKGLNIQFDTPNGLDLNTIDEEVIEALINAGLVRTCLAVESGSPEIRMSINKRLTQENIIAAFNNIKKYPKLAYNVFFIVGFPNETHETLQETYELIKQLELKRAVISFATPFPGTKLYDECVANNLLIIDQANLHNTGSFYYANDTPFIKPYKLEKQDIIDFRLKVYEELGMLKERADNHD
ncbi:MAG: radical SAM domain-containing protein [Candidatus Saganbacteria bacterium]|uniref:Radical SAM domain-containing protein n=1 Tax=Candidatus Saganbacteria bacterium TaxID=2575572 RepID=A0A833L2P8_UNCSA|nr:MAG: radical SAM domain-containing protein [Candidatus Saganbacteria bacterium]